jgi:hypothetical protein
VDSTPFFSATVTSQTTFSVPLASYPNFIVWGDGASGANNTRYSFTVTSSTTSSVGTDILNVSSVGTFHDNLGVYNDGTASLILSFNQAGGPGNTVGVIGTIQTPQAFDLAPEPDTTLLLGGALLGIGLLRRKKV